PDLARLWRLITRWPDLGSAMLANALPSWPFFLRQRRPAGRAQRFVGPPPTTFRARPTIACQSHRHVAFNALRCLAHTIAPVSFCPKIVSSLALTASRIDCWL